MPAIRLEPGDHQCIRGPDNKRFRCEFCKYLKHKGLIPPNAFVRKALYKCKRCDVYLCKTRRKGHPSCFELFHTKNPLENLSPDQYVCKVGSRPKKKRKSDEMSSPTTTPIISTEDVENKGNIDVTL